MDEPHKHAKGKKPDSKFYNRQNWSMVEEIRIAIEGMTGEQGLYQEGMWGIFLGW